MTCSLELHWPPQKRQLRFLFILIIYSAGWPTVEAGPLSTKTLSFLLPGFRAGRLLPSKAQRLCSPFSRDAVIAGCSFRLRSAEYAVLYSTTRDHCGGLRIFLAKDDAQYFCSAPETERPTPSALAEWVLAMYAQAEWISRESRRLAQPIRFRTNP